MNQYTCVEDLYSDIRHIISLKCHMHVASSRSTVASLTKVLEILVACWMVIGRTVDRRPDRLSHKQSHGFDVVLLVKSESVVDASWQNEEVSFGHFDPYPLVKTISNVKVATPSQDEANLLIRVQMLLEKCLYLFFIVR